MYKSPSQEAYYFKALKVDGDSSAAEDFNQDRHGDDLRCSKMQLPFKQRPHVYFVSLLQLALLLNLL